MSKKFTYSNLNNTSSSQRSIELINVVNNHKNKITRKKMDNTIRSREVITSTNTESNNQGNNEQQKKNIYPLNSEKKNKEIIRQEKDDNTTGLEKNMVNHLEQPSRKVINNEMEDDKNNESNRRRRDLNENLSQSSTDIEK